MKLRSALKVYALLLAVTALLGAVFLAQEYMALDPVVFERGLRARLIEAVESRGTAADPWLLAHGLIALGEQDAALRDAWVERIATRWVVRAPGRGASIPLGDASEPGERHPHLVMKCLAEVASEHYHAGARELAVLLAVDAISFFVPPGDRRGWSDSAWLLHGAAILSREAGTPFRAEAPLGTGELTLGALALGALAELEEADREHQDAPVATEGAGVSAAMPTPVESGTHPLGCCRHALLTAVIAAAAAGWIPEAELPRLERRVDHTIRRFDAEELSHDREWVRRAAAGVPESRISEDRRRMEAPVYGPALECLVTIRATSRGAATLSPRESAIGHVRDRLWMTWILMGGDSLSREGQVPPQKAGGDPAEEALGLGVDAHTLHGLSLERSSRPRR